jgi:hypothetical protein
MQGSGKIVFARLHRQARYSAESVFLTQAQRRICLPKRLEKCVSCQSIQNIRRGEKRANSFARMALSVKNGAQGYLFFASKFE